MLKKGLILAALVVALLVPAATAVASPHLDGGEARQQLGSILHEQFRYGAVAGSLRARCRNASATLVRCYITFLDRDYDRWCGAASVRETRYNYYARWYLDLC